jgi:NAD(P)-dependent dehydrogenase (short-subunit alcohol dehydrogenase family)
MGIELQDRVVLITGTSSGLGRATALRFAEEGAAIVLADRSPSPREGGETTAELLERAGARHVYVEGDVTRAADRERFVAAAEELGGLDVLVNNAGVFTRQDFLEETEAEFDRLMEINVKAVFFMAQAAAKAMAARGKGVIINLSSVAGLTGSALATTYCTSKGAVRLMSYSMAASLGPRGIRVVAIHPGLADTVMGRDDVDPDLDALREANPLGRIATPEDIADGAVFLASDRASFVNGTSLVIDGGNLRVS